MAERLQIIVDLDVKGTNDITKLKQELGGLGDAGKQASPGLSNAASGTSMLSGAIGKLVTGGLLLAAGQQLLTFGKASISAASDVQEMQSKFNTVFKDLGGSVTAELQTFADAANRSVYDLQGFAATLQDTFVPLGFARDEAAQTSVQLVKLAEDLASFNNLDTADVVRDLQSAMVGNTETLRKYGVVANQAAIDQKALELGLEFTKGQMDAQTKAAAILAITMESTTDAQGDAIKTADSYANVSKGLEAAMTDLKVAIGQGLLPVMTDAKARTAEVVTGFAGWISVNHSLQQAVADGVLTQEEANRIIDKVAMTSYTAAEAQQELTAAYEEHDAAVAAVNQRMQVQADITAQVMAAQSAADAAIQAETEAVYANMAAKSAAAAASGEFSDKQLQLANHTGTAEQAAAAANLAMQHYGETVSQLSSLISSLPSEKNIEVDLQVYGINSLERAQSLLNSLQNPMGPSADPYGGLTPGETAPKAADPYSGLSGNAIDQGAGSTYGPSSTAGGARSNVPQYASGTDGWQTVPGAMGQPYPVILHGGEEFNVIPNGGGTTNNTNSSSSSTNIVQNFYGPTDPARAGDSVKNVLNSQGIQGFA